MLVGAQELEEIDGGRQDGLGNGGLFAPAEEQRGDARKLLESDGGLLRETAESNGVTAITVDTPTHLTQSRQPMPCQVRKSLPCVREEEKERGKKRRREERYLTDGSRGVLGDASESDGNVAEERGLVGAKKKLAKTRDNVDNSGHVGTQLLLKLAQSPASVHSYLRVGTVEVLAEERHQMRQSGAKEVQTLFVASEVSEQSEDGLGCVREG